MSNRMRQLHLAHQWPDLHHVGPAHGDAHQRCRLRLRHHIELDDQPAQHSHAKRNRLRQLHLARQWSDLHNVRPAHRDIDQCCWLRLCHHIEPDDQPAQHRHPKRNRLRHLHMACQWPDLHHVRPAHRDIDQCCRLRLCHHAQLDDQPAQHRHPKRQRLRQLHMACQWSDLHQLRPDHSNIDQCCRL